MIKPSGISYDEMRPEHMVVVDLDNQVIEGDLRPSSDTRTHTVLYRAFPQIGGVAHTHSVHAVGWAQARRPLPCFGTTHADHCSEPVPCNRTADAGGSHPRLRGRNRERHRPQFRTTWTLSRFPWCLVAGHGPFAWGNSPEDAVCNAVVLEEIAHMATITAAVAGTPPPLENYVLSYHYERKHGKNAWYGQDAPEPETVNSRPGRKRGNV